MAKTLPLDPIGTVPAENSRLQLSANSGSMQTGGERYFTLERLRHVSLQCLEALDYVSPLSRVATLRSLPIPIATC